MLISYHLIMMTCCIVNFCFKPGFHMSGKSQTIGDYPFCGPSQILPIFWIICPRFSRDAMFIVMGDWSPEI